MGGKFSGQTGTKDRKGMNFVTSVSSRLRATVVTNHSPSVTSASLCNHTGGKFILSSSKRIFTTSHAYTGAYSESSSQTHQRVWRCIHPLVNLLQFISNPSADLFSAISFKVHRKFILKFASELNMGLFT